ncbi:PorT family protein [Fulvivirga ulvae]|uniref:outer membrane beta-barrel protein n=1 Tax=Fulvivirga ulvae TaxID=2904245 RepID=UPI001F1BC5AE|nr:outer membrane beta-barrel protein [Fulvivirga ulvae]UII31305.1 PorT family protein [Fulvivirga ulvae]
MIGPRIGGQMSWVSYEDSQIKEYYDIEPLYGYFGGFTVAFRVRERFFLQTDFIYSRKGKLITGTDDASKSDPELEYRSIAHHFDIPIVYRMDFKGQFGDNLAFKYFVGLGPNISYWWKGNGTLRSGELIENHIDELEYDVKFGSSSDDDQGVLVVQDANRVQLGINFATGLVLEPAGGGVYILDVRFELGHSYLYKESPAQFTEATFTDPAKGRNMGFRLGVAYLLDTKVSQRKKGKSTGKRRK